MGEAKLVTVRHFHGVEGPDGKLFSDQPISEPVQMTLEELRELLWSESDGPPSKEKLAESVEGLDYDVLIVQVKAAGIGSKGYHIWLAPADALEFIGNGEGEMPTESAAGLLSLRPDEGGTRH